MHIRLKPAAALLLPLFAGNLQATTNLDTIVVTATRFESAQQENPIAAQVITADDIRNSAATTVGEVLNKLGGVHSRINMNGVPDAPLDLRGFGATGDQNTLVLVDGQRISENELVAARISSIPLDAIERIEILRGLGAVLYGSGATGGTINIITRSALGAPLSGNVSTRIGSHDLRDVRGGVRVGGEMWGLRLNAQHYKSDNYRDNNEAEQNSGNGELRFGNKDGFVAFAFNADSQHSHLPGARTAAQLHSDRRGTASPDDYARSDTQLFTLRGEKRLGEITLALDVSQRDKNGLFNWGGWWAKTDVDNRIVSPRVLWATAFGSATNRLTVGFDKSDWDYASKNMLGTSKGTQKNSAYYLQDELLLPTGTRISLGGRKEKVEFELTGNADDDQHLSAYELALQQELGQGLAAYGRIGRSFRVANIDENGYKAVPTLLKPQRSLDRELGVTWSGKRASARAGIFQMDIDDEIHYMPYDNFGGGANTNLPPTRHRGLELEGKLRVSETVDVTARYTRTQARFRKGSFNGIDVAGNDVPLVPKNRIGLNLGWQMLDATRLGFNLTYVGDQRYDNDQPNRYRKMPNYAIADIKLTHDIGAWRLAAGINNLFDKKYYSYGIIRTDFSTFDAYPEDERNAYLSAEYRF